MELRCLALMEICNVKLRNHRLEVNLMEERYVRKVKDHEGCRDERQDQFGMDEEVTEPTVI